MIKKIQRRVESLSNELYEQQTLFDSLGLHKEIARFDDLLGIDTINSSKNDVLARNHEDNCVELAKLKKTKHLMDNNVPDYFKDTNIFRSRMSYRVRVNMVPSEKLHFKGSFKDYSIFVIEKFKVVIKFIFQLLLKVGDMF